LRPDERPAARSSEYARNLGSLLAAGAAAAVGDVAGLLGADEGRQGEVREEGGEARQIGRVAAADAFEEDAVDRPGREFEL
jgi:hypothetical protein